MRTTILFTEKNHSANNLSDYRHEMSDMVLDFYNRQITANDLFREKMAETISEMKSLHPADALKLKSLLNVFLASSHNAFGKYMRKTLDSSLAAERLQGISPETGNGGVPLYHATNDEHYTIQWTNRWTEQTTDLKSDSENFLPDQNGQEDFYFYEETIPSAR